MRVANKPQLWVLFWSGLGVSRTRIRTRTTGNWAGWEEEDQEGAARGVRKRPSIDYKSEAPWQEGEGSRVTALSLLPKRSEGGAET